MKCSRTFSLLRNVLGSCTDVQSVRNQLTNRPAIAPLHGPHSLFRYGNKARPFRSVPYPDGDSVGKPHKIHRMIQLS